MVINFVKQLKQIANKGMDCISLLTSDQIWSPLWISTLHDFQDINLILSNKYRYITRYIKCK